MVKLNAAQLRKESAKFKVQSSKLRKNDIYIILDNVLDTYNIGSIFRLADAVAAKKVYLCGQTEIPPNTRIKKASINTTEWVEWEYEENAIRVVRELRDQIIDIQIVAIEQSTKSVQYDKFNYKLPICLIVGNETNGVSKEVLKIADAIVELPMFGVNKSLNVMVSLGVVLYYVQSLHIDKIDIKFGKAKAMIVPVTQDNIADTSGIEESFGAWRQRGDIKNSNRWVAELRAKMSTRDE